MFKGLASVNLQNGRTCRMWSDLWNDLVLVKLIQSYALLQKENQCVRDGKMLEDIEYLFHFPMSLEAFRQLQLLLADLEQSANSDDKDIWSYIWGNNLFSSFRAYKQINN